MEQERQQDLLLAPYGIDSFSLASVRIEASEGRAPRISAPFPCVVIDRTTATPLQLNNAAYPACPASPDADVLAILQANIRQCCGTWDKLSHQFCAAYFEFLSAEIQADHVALARRCEPFAGLFAPSDWLYCAPRPLPRAHVFAPAGEATGTEADYIKVDFAFWLGAHFSVAIAAPVSLTPARAMVRDERLSRAGISVAPFSARDLSAPADLFTRILAGRPAHYWSREPIPVGPFRPTGFTS
ncbi:MAG: hypothetical protein JWO64_3348 [Hyphomicrobiales bacterium]|nr:hypothetical protein [Hyphomicrobiales bacterium]